MSVNSTECRSIRPTAPTTEVTSRPGERTDSDDLSGGVPHRNSAREEQVVRGTTHRLRRLDEDVADDQQHSLLRVRQADEAAEFGPDGGDESTVDGSKATLRGVLLLGAGDSLRGNRDDEVALLADDADGVRGEVAYLHECLLRHLGRDLDYPDNILFRDRITKLT